MAGETPVTLCAAHFHCEDRRICCPLLVVAQHSIDPDRHFYRRPRYRRLPLRRPTPRPQLHAFAWDSDGTLPLLYTAVRSMLQSLARRRGLPAPATAPGEEAAAESKVEVQIQRFARVIFILMTVILLANYWGIDTQAFKTLDELNLYRIRGVGDVVEFVTVADLIRAALFLVATFWILRALPGIYEFTLFSRLRLDEGMKYATLTMSRYGIFVIGMLLTLSEMHLDLGRLGWLMAAVGVGLGFGLQEIVSNFVSGIILLVERPVSWSCVIVSTNGSTASLRSTASRFLSRNATCTSSRVRSGPKS